MPTPREDFAAFAAVLNLQHFTADELLHKTDAARGAAHNSLPPRGLWPNIVPTILVLDALRGVLGAPIHVTSIYRDPDYNQAVGGGRRSQHQDFRAIDFRCDRGTPDAWAEILQSWRGRPFPSPIPLPLVRRQAPLDLAGLQINTTAQGTAFAFAGGIGVYPAANFVHVDCRGFNASWRGS